MFTEHISIDEFRSRRQKLCSEIDHQGIVLIQGAPEPLGNSTFDQYKDFLYLCGLESPRAYLLIDGKNAHTTLYLQHGTSMIRESPKPLPCAENAEYVKGLTGVDSVRGVEELGESLSDSDLLYTPFHNEARGANRTHLVRWAARLSADPWDTCVTRSAQFIETIKRQFPQIQIVDLVPIMDELRLIKSPAEIALLRRAGELTAAAVTEAMRSTRPGLMEYHLAAVAQYYFFAGGAKERGYRATCASGEENILNGHYADNDSMLMDGDMVLMDNAPDYDHYVSDIGRMWPVNGTYSPFQRTIYGFVVEYHKAILASIAPGKTVEDVKNDAAKVMHPVIENWEFQSPLHRETGRNLRAQISHAVGLTVHDGNLHYSRPFVPGMVFSVDPSFILKEEEKLYMRIEDTVVVTEDGIENLTGSAPTELDDVESIMGGGNGILQAFPPA